MQITASASHDKKQEPSQHSFNISPNETDFTHIRGMIQYSIELRIRYSETDRMGYAYYGNYATYFEVARVETLRSIGITYKKLEDDGVLLPVVDFHVRYFAPAHYDDVIRIETTIAALPGARMRFHYQTYRGVTLLNEAETDLVFVDEKSGKPMRCPADISALLNAHFQ